MKFTPDQTQDFATFLALRSLDLFNALRDLYHSPNDDSAIHAARELLADIACNARGTISIADLDAMDRARNSGGES
jgi:hypothetical protein